MYQYLLTYDLGGDYHWKWFETEEELKKYVKDREGMIRIFDSLKITQSEEISLEG
jgi:hypothetical protein